MAKATRYFRAKTNSFFTPLKEKENKKQALFRKKNEACFVYNESISIAFSRAFAKNFDCRTYVRRRSFFTKNNFVSLALYQLEDFVFKLTPTPVGVFVFIWSLLRDHERPISSFCFPFRVVIPYFF